MFGVLHFLVLREIECRDPIYKTNTLLLSYIPFPLNLILLIYHWFIVLDHLNMVILSFRVELKKECNTSEKKSKMGQL